MSRDWPYNDLVCRTPDCPMCGHPGAMLVGPMLHPMAFCENEDCPALTWDPTKSWAELRANARPIEWISDE